jgi:hypothetical protein
MILWRKTSDWLLVKVVLRSIIEYVLQRKILMHWHRLKLYVTDIRTGITVYKQNGTNRTLLRVDEGPSFGLSWRGAS